MGSELNPKVRQAAVIIGNEDIPTFDKPLNLEPLDPSKYSIRCIQSHHGMQSCAY